MSSQFISILLEFFWILYCSQTHLLRTSNELLKHYPNTVGMQDPAMTTVSSLPAQFRPTQNQVEPAEPKHLDIFGCHWHDLLSAMRNAIPWHCTWFCRSFIHDTVPGGSRRDTLDMPGCIWMSYHYIWCTVNSTLYKIWCTRRTSHSYQRPFALTKSVYSARDRWSKHQYLVSKLPSPSVLQWDKMWTEHNRTQLGRTVQPWNCTVAKLMTLG